MTEQPLKILSLGAGIQSTTLLLMSCAGILPRLDAAIFADIGWESQATYKHLGRLATHAATHGIPLLQVGLGNLKKEAMEHQVKNDKRDGRRWGSLPYYTKDPDGKEGMVRRTCTKEYKIQPLERKLRELLGLKPRQRAPIGAVETWKGISVDEKQRCSLSPKRWIYFCYPLIEDLLETPGYEKAYDRWSCILWLREHWSHTVPRSSCLCCPFHSQEEWRKIRENPDEWKDVVEFDRAIRNMDGMNSQTFLHRKRIPLDEVDFSTEEDYGQLSLFGKCDSGMCGT